jgi:membrane protein
VDLDKVKTLYNNVTPQMRDLFSIFIKRCKEDNITISAGHLAYVTLLSLVPFIMVTFTIMSAFPAFASVRSKLEHFVFSNFVPTASDVVHKYMTDFVGNASQMSAIGILSLLVVALMLISNVDKTLNRIWRTQSDRPIVYTFAIYWMVITLGPMLIGSRSNFRCLVLLCGSWRLLCSRGNSRACYCILAIRCHLTPNQYYQRSAF